MKYIAYCVGFVVVFAVSTKLSLVENLLLLAICLLWKIARSLEKGPQS